MKNKTILVTKASGEMARYSPANLRHSLEKAGAGETEIQRILESVQEKLYEGISTKKIYRIAFNMLKESSRNLAARYHLKRAIMELGPSGFPFEKFVSEILAHQGYRVSVGQIVQGKCVSHEIDVIAEKDHHHFMIECKYHNQAGIFCDVKVPLYIQARFKDVEAQWLQLPGHGTKFHQGWVVTNTRFSSDAIQFGTCAGLHLLGWDYPAKNSLKYLIEKLGLYPITCLTSITRTEKQKLLDRKIVLCKDICEDENLLAIAGISQGRVKTVMQEVNQLCAFAVPM